MLKTTLKCFSFVYFLTKRNNKLELSFVKLRAQLSSEFSIQRQQSTILELGIKEYLRIFYSYFLIRKIFILLLYLSRRRKKYQGGCFNIFFFLSNMGRIFFSLFFSCFQEQVFRFKKYSFSSFQRRKRKYFFLLFSGGGGLLRFMKYSSSSFLKKKKKNFSYYYSLEKGGGISRSGVVLPHGDGD